MDQTYEASGRLIDCVTSYTYDGHHRMLTITDRKSITYLTNEYDAQRRHQALSYRHTIGLICVCFPLEMSVF